MCDVVVGKYIHLAGERWGRCIHEPDECVADVPCPQWAKRIKCVDGIQRYADFFYYTSKIIYGRVFSTYADACIWAAYRTLAMRGEWGDPRTVGIIAVKFAWRWSGMPNNTERAIESNLDVYVYTKDGQDIARYRREDQSEELLSITDELPPQYSRVERWYCAVCNRFTGMRSVGYVPPYWRHEYIHWGRRIGYLGKTGPPVCTRRLCIETARAWSLDVRKMAERLGGARGTNKIVQTHLAALQLRKQAYAKSKAGNSAENNPHSGGPP